MIGEGGGEEDPFAPSPPDEEAPPAGEPPAAAPVSCGGGEPTRRYCSPPARPRRSPASNPATRSSPPTRKPPGQGEPGLGLSAAARRTAGARGEGRPPSIVWETLREAGADPTPGRPSTIWAGFLRSPAEALLVCGFFETVTLTGTRMFVFAVTAYHTRRIRGTAQLFRVVRVSGAQEQAPPSVRAEAAGSGVAECSGAAGPTGDVPQSNAMRLRM
jgi:hypothetical protein